MGPPLRFPCTTRKRTVVGHAVIDDDPAWVAKVNTHRWFHVGGYAYTHAPYEIEDLTNEHETLTLTNKEPHHEGRSLPHR